MEPKIKRPIFFTDTGLLFCGMIFQSILSVHLIFYDLCKYPTISTMIIYPELFIVTYTTVPGTA